MLLRFFWVLCCCVVSVPSAFAERLSVAVAANFAGPVQALAEAFADETGQTVQLSTGSSGQLFAQIRNGAPFDVFLSADQAKPAALIDSGDAVAESRFTYAIGALVLWSASANRFDDGQALLTQGDVERLAIANPRLAPYGVAAEQVLDHLGVSDSLAERLVQGQNIAQTYQFVASGNADVGLVALSQILDHGRVRSGTAWIVPMHYYAPIRQDAVLLTRAADNPQARAFLDYLRSDTAQAQIESYGYRSEADL